MGESLCREYDREVDPVVIAKRNSLFDKYVTPYYNMIYKLCIRYSYESRNVQENYNEVLINFYRRIETYDPDRPIKTWLHIVTKRHVFELERRRCRDNNKNNDLDIEEYEEELFSDNKKVYSVLDEENYRQHYSDEVLAVLDTMKSIHKEALLLQESGYSLKEIADIEHERGTLKSKNIETVKSRLFLARKHLRTHLTRDGKLKPNE